MPGSVGNLPIIATNLAGAQVLFDTAIGDKAASVYTIHNRDATNYVRVVVSPLHNGADGGVPIAPGATIPFKFTSGGGGITKVIAWAEGGTPAVDGFVEGG